MRPVQLRHKLLKAIPLAVVFALSLSGCLGAGKTTPTPLPTVVLGGEGANVSAPSASGAAASLGAGVRASGVVAPAQQASLVFTLSGKIDAVEAAVGDRVQAGQPLLYLAGKEDLQAAIASAEFELASAQKAQQDLSKSVQELRAKALARISDATKAVRDATYQLDNFTVPSGQAHLSANQALQQTQASLDAARVAFEPYRYFPSTNNTREDLKEILDRAQADYNAAVKRLQYETALQVAQVDLAEALQVFEDWKEGPDPAEVAVSQSRLANAQAALDAARAQLDKLALKAPFAGTVARLDVHSGEWVIPGQAVLLLADLDHMRVETTDLSERDLPKIEIGQHVTVLIEALGLEVGGRLSQISPLADMLGGDVVYRTIIDLDELPQGLFAGMSVEVNF